MPLDLCHTQMIGAHGDRRGGSRSCGTRHLTWLLKCRGAVEPEAASGAHGVNRRLPALIRQAREQVQNTVEPARDHRFGIGRAHGPGEPDLGRGNRLLEIMRREANAPFWQQEPHLITQGAVEPWVRLGRFRPTALIQPGKDQEIGALHARL